MNAGPSGLGWCVCGTGECTCACVGYEFCHLTVDSNLPFDAWTRCFLPEYYHGFTQKSEYPRRRSFDWKQIFKNVFMHIFILDLKMVGSKCSKSDWVFVYVLRENYAAVSCVTERPPFVTDKYGKCYWQPSYRVGISDNVYCIYCRQDLKISGGVLFCWHWFWQPHLHVAQWVTIILDCWLLSGKLNTIIASLILCIDLCHV